MTARGRYDAPTRTYTLGLEQSCRATPGQPTSSRSSSRSRWAWSARDGRELPLRLEGEADSRGGTERVLVLDDARAFFTFVDVDERAGALAAARLLGAGDAGRRPVATPTCWCCCAHDSDPFNRWEAGQRLALNAPARGGARRRRACRSTTPSSRRCARCCATRRSTPAFKELVLTLPSETYVAEQLDAVDPQRIHAVREAHARAAGAGAARRLGSGPSKRTRCSGGYSPDPVSAGRRALANLALAHAVPGRARSSGDAVWPGRAYQRFKDAGNMTDRSGRAGGAGRLAARAGRRRRCERFHAHVQDEPLVLDKWFALQAGAPERGGRRASRASSS